MNRYLAGILMLILISGCLELPSTTEQPENGVGPISASTQCRMVYVEEPYEEEECREVAYTEEQCARRELSYSVTPIVKTDICTQNGDCVGKALLENIDCLYTCTQAMKRCQMNITNNDPQYDGVWVVGATFSYKDAAFVKNPLSVEIPDGESFTFSFEQIYSLGTPPTFASCSLSVLYPAIVRECIQVEKARIDCMNVTKVRIVQQEVCD